jgi:Kef-type K+ transport system membrane component KefB
MALSRLRSHKKLPTFLIYLGVMSLGVWIIHYIDHIGLGLLAPALPGDATPGGKSPEQINTLLHVLLALAVVIVTARAVGALFKFFNQPAVIGEVIGGILLGPSFLGRLSQSTLDFVLPHSAAPFLGIIAQLGVILYMFIVGLELDLKVLRRSGHSTLAISHASILVPFILGMMLALHLYPQLSNSSVPFRSFALFLGVSLSVTAFPVLARILTDRRVHKTRMGTIALTCAAVDDVTAWCLLAFVVSMSQAKIGGAVSTLVLTIAYVALMFFGVRPLIARVIPFLEKFDRVTEGGLALAMVALLLSALATEAIGIHAIFGAFLLGAVTPHDSRIAQELANRLDDLVRVLFLPAFFAFTGMRTQFGLLSSQAEWVLCGAIILIATAGKFGGTFVAARLTGLNWTDSAALGVLMNTRGLVELIVLNIGLDMKVISPTLFAMLVLMALVTTFATTPALNLLTHRRPWTADDPD